MSSPLLEPAPETAAEIDPLVEDGPVAPEPAAAPDAASMGDDLTPQELAADEATLRQIRELPREVGVMLMAVGSLGFVLPGVMGAPAIVAGGLVLWPKAFGRVESWLERRYPKVHHQSMRQIGRYLNDLEKRYPRES